MSITSASFRESFKLEIWGVFFRIVTPWLPQTCLMWRSRTTPASAPAALMNLFLASSLAASNSESKEVSLG